MRITKAVIEAVKNNPRSIVEYDTKDVDKIIKHLDDKYYNTGKPLVTDETYDLIKEIVEKNAAKAAKAAKAEVGADPIDDDRKTKLPFWMGSMDKLTSQAQLARFMSKRTGHYVVSDKVDGVSALLIVAGGGVKMYTRGNGVHGQDVSSLVKHVKNIDTALLIGEECVIRGELIITKANFETVSHLGANARNMVSGIVNSKRPKKELLKLLDFVGYTLIQPELKPSEQYNFINNVGIQTVYQSKRVKTFDEKSLTAMLQSRKDASPYEIDGVIVTHDKIYDLEQGKNPSYAFAFKNMSLLDSKETTVLDVEWSISKDGYIKPVVVIAPVHLSGVTIRKATGFNAGFIRDNKIGPGAVITITRSGDVIPYIKNVVKQATAKFPTDIKYKWNETKKDIMTMEDTFEQDFKRLENFYNKIKVKWLSTATLRKLYDKGYTKPIQVFNIDVDELSGVIGAAMAKKIISERSATFASVACHTLMDASNAFGRGFGEKRLELVTKVIPKTLHGYVPTIEEMVSISGISAVTGKQFIDGMRIYKQFARDNPFRCGKPVGKSPVKKKSSASLSGKIVLFTGFRDKPLEALVKDAGGTVVSSMSKKVNILVVKENTRNKKTEFAEEHGIRMVTAAELRAML